ncbi:protein of unknown function [Methylorubrum extorquens]|uniref:Uncharacterized protein n=1 Tax=Methylorubrum extorquens TaxID=408 RepID=A0A2N9AHL5_METEX|nr:protein of unknown function [Methylorubrum extorquens]
MSPRAIAGNGEALVQSQTLLSAQIGKVAADVTSEIQVRAAADAAQTTRIDGAVSRIGTAEARLVTEEQTRASETSALSSRLTSVTSRVGSSEAAITTLGQAITDNFSSAASQFQGISVRFGSVEGKVASSEANIQTLFTSYAAGDAANAQAINVLRADVNTHVGNLNAFNVETRQVIVNGDSAQATRTDQLVAQTNGDRAYFLSENSARFNQTEGGCTCAECTGRADQLGSRLFPERANRTDQSGWRLRRPDPGRLCAKRCRHSSRPDQV